MKCFARHFCSARIKEYNRNSGTTPGGVYGDVSWWTVVEPFKAQIEAAGGVFADTLLGDVNLDGVVNFLDISPFIALLSSADFQAEGDVDQNGFVNFLDIVPFIQRLSSPQVGLE